MSVIGKVFKDKNENHVVVISQGKRLPQGFAYEVMMYKIRYMTYDKESWFSKMLFLNCFTEVKD
jgi:hypothetical protein